MCKRQVTYQNNDQVAPVGRLPNEKIANALEALPQMPKI
jgi:hypothetical protein